jgi:hypothetical protein
MIIEKLEYNDIVPVRVSMEHQIDLQKRKKSPVDFRSQSQTEHGMQNSKQSTKNNTK